LEHAQDSKTELTLCYRFLGQLTLTVNPTGYQATPAQKIQNLTTFLLTIKKHVKFNWGKDAGDSQWKLSRGLIGGGQYSSEQAQMGSGLTHASYGNQLLISLFCP
jgi:hypothetical protein